MRTLTAAQTTELCTNLPPNYGHLSIQENQLGPNAVLYIEIPLCSATELSRPCPFEVTHKVAQFAFSIASSTPNLQ